MLVVGLAFPELRIAVVVELAGFFLHLRLAAEEHALRTNDTRAPGLRERGDDVQDEGVIAIRSRRRFERRPAPEAAEQVFVTFLGEDFLLQLVLLLFVI